MRRSIPRAACLAALVFLACLPGCWLMVGIDKKDLDQDSDAGDAAEADAPPEETDQEQISDPFQDDDDTEGASCTSSADCSDREPCNGQETCSAEGFCEGGAPLPDNTTCVTPSGRTGVCRLYMCIPEGCGDSELDYGEECDDGNMILEDGCEPDCLFSCHGDEECLDPDPCVDASCADNDNGKVCEETYTYQPCDDENPCTETDLCNGAGDCTGSGDPCDDELDCTEQECTPTDGSYACYYDPVSGTCYIDSACFESGQANPLNACQICDPDAPTSWTPVADFVSTCGTDGRCCDGECIEGAECCIRQDCGPGCTGTARPCSEYPADISCTDHEGCMVSISRCYRHPTAVCETIFSQVECDDECDCFWDSLGDPPSCSQLSSNCSSYTESGPCLSDCMCRWSDERCAGTATPCSSFPAQAACLGQDGCDWVQFLPCTEDFKCL